MTFVGFELMETSCIESDGLVVDVVPRANERANFLSHHDFCREFAFIILNPHAAFRK